MLFFRSAKKSCKIVFSFSTSVLDSTLKILNSRFSIDVGRLRSWFSLTSSHERALSLPTHSGIVLILFFVKSRVFKRVNSSIDSGIFLMLFTQRFKDVRFFKSPIALGITVNRLLAKSRDLN